MQTDILKQRIEMSIKKPSEDFTQNDIDIFIEFKSQLNKGSLRAAEFKDGTWITNAWVKQGILLGFRLGSLVEMKWSKEKIFFDKNTYPEQNFSIQDKVRIVPGGTSIRDGAYVAPGVTIMPPAYVNVGSYIDEGTMVDSHALVGSCAQVGKNVHLSAAAILGGVIEPINANPVIIEDNCFIGGNTGIYEGVIVQKFAIIAAGVILTAGTPVYDAVNHRFLDKIPGKAVIIPTKAVVVPGSRPLKGNEGFSIYCPIIIKYRDEKSDVSVELESAIR